MKREAGTRGSIGQGCDPQFGKFMVLEQADEVVSRELLPQPVEVGGQVTIPCTCRGAGLFLPRGERQSDPADVKFLDAASLDLATRV